MGELQLGKQVEQGEESEWVVWEFVFVLELDG